MIMRFALFGQPVAHSKSPVIHAAFAKAHRIKLEYLTIEAPPETFAEQLAQFWREGGAGANITLPHKQTAYGLLSGNNANNRNLRSPAADRAGAVNTLTRIDGEEPAWKGDNTDGVGFIRDLVGRHQVPIKGKRVVILGAGGAAQGILGPLCDEKPAELVIANRTREHAERLAERFPEGQALVFDWEELESLGPFDLLINATALGFQRSRIPWPDTIIDERSICYDLSYGEPAQAFLNWGQSCGATRCIDGLGMLVEQAALSFELWHGVLPKTEPVLDLLRNNNIAVMKALAASVAAQPRPAGYVAPVVSIARPPAVPPATGKVAPVAKPELAVPSAAAAPDPAAIGRSSDNAPKGGKKKAPVESNAATPASAEGARRRGAAPAAATEAKPVTTPRGKAAASTARAERAAGRPKAAATPAKETRDGKAKSAAGRTRPPAAAKRSSTGRTMQPSRGRATGAPAVAKSPRGKATGVAAGRQGKASRARPAAKPTPSKGRSTVKAGKAAGQNETTAQRRTGRSVQGSKGTAAKSGSKAGTARRAATPTRSAAASKPPTSARASKSGGFLAKALAFAKGTASKPKRGSPRSGKAKRG